jgi:uncharacterized membrane protein
VLRAILLIAGALPFVVFLSLWIPALAPIADLLEHWFAFHCHRAPPRTVRLFGYGLPVCARCTGLYGGLLLGALIGQPRVENKRLPQATLLGGALLVLDVATEAIGWRVPSLAVRLFTGVAFALPAALIALQQAEARRSQRPR